MFQRALSPLPGGGSDTKVKTGTLEDITTIKTEIEIDTGVKNINRFILMCDNGTTFTQVTVWDKTYQGTLNGANYYNCMIYGTSHYFSSKEIGTNDSFFTVVSVDETNGIFKVKAVSSTYLPLKNIVWYAE